MKQYMIGALSTILGMVIIGGSYYKGFKKGVELTVQAANEKNEKIAKYVKAS